MTNSQVRIGLMALCAVPVLAGAARFHEVSSGIVTAENARFLAVPFPIQAHVVCASLFGLLGALQLTGGQGSTRAHRIVGVIVVLCGSVVALTGFWMTLFYPPAGFDGVWVFWTRLLAGVAMAFSLAVAVAAIVKRKFGVHKAWMIRAYALGMGAGTQVITHLPWFLFPVLQGEAARTIAMAAGWGINLAIAEWVIRGPALLQGTSNS